LLLAFAAHFLAAALNLVLHWFVAALRCAVQCVLYCAVPFRAAAVFPASLSCLLSLTPVGMALPAVAVPGKWHVLQQAVAVDWPP
jgi:hypothetical protein